MSSPDILAMRSGLRWAPDRVRRFTIKGEKPQSGRLSRGLYPKNGGGLNEARPRHPQSEGNPQGSG